MYLVVLVSLVAVLVPELGTEIGGARRWFDLGPISLQPAELAKLAAVVALSIVVARLAPGSGLPARPLLLIGAPAPENDSFSYSAKDFTVSGEGMEEAGPIRHQLGAGTLAPATAVSGALVFQAPEKAKNLTLSFGDSRQPVALDLKPGEGGHGHGGGKENDGHGH